MNVLGTVSIPTSGTYILNFTAEHDTTHIAVVTGVDTTVDFTLLMASMAKFATQQVNIPVTLLLPMPSKYRFGFNGQEKVDEVAGVGNHYAYGVREYDPRDIKFWTPDERVYKYPQLSPYIYSGNSPIVFGDYDGRDFGVKYEPNKTTVYITLYAKDDFKVSQAQAGANAWNAASGKFSVNGSVIYFEAKVENVGALKEFTERRDQKLAQGNSAVVSNVNAVYNIAKKDPIGNAYYGNEGSLSKTLNSMETTQEFVGGYTSSDATHMNSVADRRDYKSTDMGDQKALVAHEFGHLMGLSDKGKTYYPGDGGIMEYGIQIDSEGNARMNPINENDVRTILRYANDYLNNKVDKANVNNPTVTEIKDNSEKNTEEKKTSDASNNSSETESK